MLINARQPSQKMKLVEAMIAKHLLAADKEKERDASMSAAPTPDAAGLPSTPRAMTEPVAQQAGGGVRIQPRINQPIPPPVVVAAPAPVPPSNTLSSSTTPSSRTVPPNPTIPVSNTLPVPTGAVTVQPGGGPAQRPPDLAVTPIEHNADVLPEQTALDAAKAAPVKAKPRWLSALQSALYSASDEFRRHPANDWNGVMRGVGAAATGAVGGIIKPRFIPQLQHDYAVEQAQTNLDRALRTQAATAAVDYKRTQSDRVLTKDARDQKVLELRGYLEQAKLRLRGQGLSDAEVDRAARRSLIERGLANREDLADLGWAGLDYRAEQDRIENKRKADNDVFEHKHKLTLAKIAGARAEAYQRAVSQSGNKQSANEAAAAAEADMYASSADEVLQEIDYLETATPDSDKSDPSSGYNSRIGQLHRQEREYRMKAGRAGIKSTGSLAARSNAGRPVTQMTRDEIIAAARAAGKDEKEVVRRWEALTKYK